MEATENDNLKFQTAGLRKRNNAHNFFHIGLILLNCVVFAVMIFFNIAAGQDWGIFQNSTGDISNANEVNITPAGWTFSTWGIIYTWQTLWLIFNVVLIFIKYENLRLYREPPVLTPLFHIFIFANFCFNAGWLALWDQQHFTWSFILILFMLLSLYVALVISHNNIYNSEPFLRNKKWVLVCYRALVNNGLAFYATWLTVATCLNLAIAMTYEWVSSDQIDEFRNVSAIISLCILGTLLAIYFSLDIYFLEKFLRYTFSTYLQLFIAFSGILSKNWNGGESGSSILTLILVIMVGIMFVVKIGVSIYKFIKNR